MMRSAGVEEAKIILICQQQRTSRPVLTLTFRRGENELGYCRVTLALENRSAEYLNQLSLTSFDGLFEIFRFQNILPGTLGYASAKSRELLTCEELRELKLKFHWPISLKIGGKIPTGKRLLHYRPAIISDFIQWGP